MPRKKRRRQFKKVTRPGSPPGTVPKESGAAATIKILAYSPARAHAIAPATLAELPEVEQQHDVVWIDVTGTLDTKLLLSLADRYGLHMLSIEDVMNVHQRAKFESHERYNFCVLRMFVSRTESEQLSIFQTGKTVITVQEREGDCLRPLRQRIESRAGNIRFRASDYLLYAIIDSVVDHYFPILEEFDGLLTEYDDELASPNSAISNEMVHTLRRELTELRKWLRPHREMVGQILRSENGIEPETLVFMKDCQDHIVQLAEGIDHCLETCNILRDYHFNVVSGKTNEIMKTLTIISTIFIPLSFLTGVFGMNFQTIPGLHSKYGFAILLAGMISISCGMLAWFYRRGWFR